MSGPPDPKPIRIKPPKNRFIKRKAKVKKKRVKLKSISYLKKKVWVLFSLWIRRRDSVNGMNSCISCGKVKKIEELQAGHLIPGRHSAVLFDETGVFPQCYYCNGPLHGNQRAYANNLKKKLGVDEAWIDQKFADAKKIVKFSRSDLESLIAKYEGS